MSLSELLTHACVLKYFFPHVFISSGFKVSSLTFGLLFTLIDFFFFALSDTDPFSFFYLWKPSFPVHLPAPFVKETIISSMFLTPL